MEGIAADFRVEEDVLQYVHYNKKPKILTKSLALALILYYKISTGDVVDMAQMITAEDLGSMMTMRMITITSGGTEMASAGTIARGHAVAVTAAADRLGLEVCLNKP